MEAEDLSCQIGIWLERENRESLKAATNHELGKRNKGHHKKELAMLSYCGPDKEQN